MELTVTGKTVLVDDVDAALLAPYRWRIYLDKNTEYVIGDLGKDEPTVRMHRLILGLTDPAIHVDHKNGDGLDNRKSNLRVATNQLNSENRRARVHSSIYKGVGLHKGSGKWQARITISGKLKHLGRFDNEIEAALAYDDAARKNFSWPTFNFPKAGERGATLSP